MINNELKETYDKCYAMLTKSLERSSRKDWVFIKNCYKKIQGGPRIIEEFEYGISKGIKLFYSLQFTEDSSTFIPLCHKNRFYQYVVRINLEHILKKIILSNLHAVSYWH